MNIIIKREMIEDLAIISGLIGVQFLYAANTVVLSYLMSLGISSSSLIILSNFATFLVLFPFSICFERRQWPQGFAFKVWIQLLLISFGGVTLFQSLLLTGINLTSPAMATAMPNLAPGLIFIIAWAFKLETVDISCIYSKAKIMGTLLCVTGAFVMSFMQSTVDPLARDNLISLPSRTDHTFDKEKIIGCLYLLAAVFVLSSTIVLQAKTLNDFPAPISLSAITSFIGVFMTGLVQFIQGGTFENRWALIGVRELIAYTLLAGFMGGGCTSFNTWAMKKRGPVLVSMFSPVGTVISVILSVITLGDSVTAGSLAGMCLMFTGLYFVLWAKGKEGFSNIREEHDNIYDSEYDVEKPLMLS